MPELSYQEFMKRMKQSNVDRNVMSIADKNYVKFDDLMDVVKASKNEKNQSKINKRISKLGLNSKDEIEFLNIINSI